jgi:magnesium and cobalt transporter
MSEDPSSPSSNQGRATERSWLERLMHTFSAEPKSQQELLEVIKEAARNHVLDSEALGIIEGALGVSNLQVREIMVPRSQMVIIKHTESPQEFLPKVINSGHSRFPVIGDSIDDVKGILLAKDLLPLILKSTDSFNLIDILRPANIIPEGKRLNILLKEFREKRYHMALVIDEYGGVSGLVTIEDILEEIVGDIEDETDDEDEDTIRQVADHDFILKALTPIEEFNQRFNAQFSDDEFDTIGGILTHAFGHLPNRNEVIDIQGFTFRVLYADSRQVHLIRLTTPNPKDL